jgi:adenylate cyclase class 2
LKKLGAKQTRPLTQMVRATFDLPDKDLDKKHGWVRVRDEGDAITMSYKQVDDESITGTKEVCLVVDSFDKAVDFLNQVGLKQKSLQETKRESWKLNGAEIDLDEWPWLPPFVEIEAENKDKLKTVAESLGFTMSSAMHGSADFVYAKYYSVTTDEVNLWSEIKFVDVPEWLKVKKKEEK